MNVHFKPKRPRRLSVGQIWKRPNGTCFKIQYFSRLGKPTIHIYRSIDAQYIPSILIHKIHFFNKSGNRIGRPMRVSNLLRSCRFVKTKLSHAERDLLAYHMRKEAKAEAAQLIQDYGEPK